MTTKVRGVSVLLAMLGAASCIGVSYTDLNEEHRDAVPLSLKSGQADYYNIEVREVLPPGVTPPSGWGESAEDRQEVVEGDVEFAEAAEGAREAAAESAEEKEEQTEADEGVFADRIESIILEAHLEIIFARDATGTPDVCTYDVVTGPGLAKQEVQLRYAHRNGPSQTLQEVAGLKDCTTDGGWYYDDPSEPTRMLMCPVSCDWARTAEGANAEIVIQKR